MSDQCVSLDGERLYTILDEQREHGRTRVLIKCPFCSGEFWAYRWSLCGSGKKCVHCDAKHGRYGATPPKPKKKLRGQSHER